jgi:hypothetical protein
MRLPIQSRPLARPAHAGAYEEGAQEGVHPQQQRQSCTPCVQRGRGRWCVSFPDPIFGRKCFNVPSPGSWKACCSVRWSANPVVCRLSRC